MEGGELADRVAVADLEAHRLVGELQVLRIHAEADRRIDAILAADHRRPVELDVRSDLRPVADGDVRPDDRERPDGHAVADPGGSVDDGEGMNAAHRTESRSTVVDSNSASA